MLAIIWLLFLSVHLNAQESKIANIRNESGLECVVLLSVDRADTIAKFAFDINIEDYKIFDEKTIGFIMEMSIAYSYYSFSKKDGEWVMNLTSGQIVGNNKLLSAPMPELSNSQPLEGSFKIVDKGILKYGTLQGEIIVHTSEMEKKNKLWIERCKRNN